MDVLHLLGDGVVLLGGGLPLTHEIVNQLQPFHQVIQLNKDANILLRLIIHNIDVDMWTIIPFLLLLLLLAMGIPEFLDHPAELHHVDRSTCDLSTDHIFLVTFFDKVLLDYA